MSTNTPIPVPATAVRPGWFVRHEGAWFRVERMTCLSEKASLYPWRIPNGTANVGPKGATVAKVDLLEIRLSEHKGRRHMVIERFRDDLLPVFGTDQTRKVQAAQAEGACERCGGSGVIDAFSHINGGECFACGGHGKSNKERDAS